LEKRERGRIQGLPKFFGCPSIIPGMCKATDFKFGVYIYRANPNKNPLKYCRKGSVGVSRDCSIFGVPPIISERGKATDFEFGVYIYRTNPNKSPLKFLENTERGYIHGLPNFWGYLLLSQKRVKLWTSNLAGTFTGPVWIKAHKNVGNSSRGRSQGVPKIFRAQMYSSHCAVIFATAQLSCIVL